MSKQLHLIVDANVIFDFAETITHNLNEKHGTNYSVFEFYGDRFKSVLGNRMNQDIVAEIEKITADNVNVRKKTEILTEALRELINEEKVDFEVGDYGDAFREKPYMREVDFIELGEPVIYVGSDYKLCKAYYAGIKVLFKNDLEHKRNQVLGNEDNFYIVNTFEDLTELVKFYAENVEMVK